MFASDNRINISENQLNHSKLKGLSTSSSFQLLFIFKYSIFHETWFPRYQHWKTHYKILNLEIVGQHSIYRSKKYSMCKLWGLTHGVKSTIIIFKDSPGPVCVIWRHKFDMSYIVKRVISSCWLLDSIFQADV